jgi:hypothetical protein
MQKKRNANNYRWCTEWDSKGQLTVFIILAILIAVGIGLFFVFRSDLITPVVPQEIEPVYSFYLSCIEEEVIVGSTILGHQGGYIESPEFSPGSSYMPFSSHLGFLGTGISYWYYVSGNGVPREQVPSKEKMESELNDFVKERLQNCNFSGFEEQGFKVEFNSEEIEADSKIGDSSIEMNINHEINIRFGETSWRGTRHSVDVDSNLGKFYDLARKIYAYQMESMFLENYGIDILRLYAPVDGVEMGCSPKIWAVDSVRRDLINALEANIPAIKLQGDYYTLRNPDNKYFVQDIGESVDVNVNFMYSRDWPMKMEVWPSEDGLLRADPIGLQQGLGILGFCYVPYHHVYDFAFPVLMQIYDGREIFQFPIVVVIDKNKPRDAGDLEGLPDVVPELCVYKNTPIVVRTYNTNLEPVEADIKFKCFDTTCDIGRTLSDGRDAVLQENFPQCVNGFILASAEGYETKKYVSSTVNQKSVDIVLDREYSLDLEVTKNGNNVSNAIVTFDKEGRTRTVVYPEQQEIVLTEGQYDIKVYIYTQSNINLQGGTNYKCVEVPRTGLLGTFGFTEEKCFNLEVPDQIVSDVVSGGGMERYYTTESELQDSDRLIIDVPDFGVPASVEDLQVNYNKIEISGLNVEFI